MTHRIVAGVAALTLTLCLAQTLPAQIVPKIKKTIPKPDPTELLKKLPNGRKETRMKTFIGTYTDSGSKGIYVLDFDPATGKFTETPETVAAKNPTFLALAPNGKTLFACEEIGDYEGKYGTVVSFSVNHDTGALTRTSTQSSEGSSPCHVLVDGMGKHLFTANYGDGVIASFPIARDGMLGKAVSIRKQDSVKPGPHQDSPHAHAVYLDPANHYACSCDLGTDSLFVYRYDGAKGTLTPNNPPTVSVAPGAGPRHFAMHKNGRDAYILCELDSTLVHLHYDGMHGSFTTQEVVSTLPEGATKAGNSTAEVEISPNGKFLYASNRGHDSIAIFALDGTTGKLSPVQNVLSGGKHPRHFAIDPTGKWLIVANRDTDNLVTFALDATTGHLTPTGDTYTLPHPVCIVFTPQK